MSPAWCGRSSSRTARRASTVSPCSTSNPPDAAVSADPSRKQARRDALFLLSQLDLTRTPLDELVRGHRLREGYEPDEFTLLLVKGVIRRQTELDALLEAQS